MYSEYSMPMPPRAIEHHFTGPYAPLINDEDVYADAETLTSVGHGTDEDYGYYGDTDIWFDLGWDA